MFKSRLNRLAIQAAFSVSILLSVTLAVAQVGPSPRPLGVKRPPGATELIPNGVMPAAAVLSAGKPVVTKYGNLTITETALPMPNLWTPDVFKVSPDCQRVAMIGYDGKKSYVVCDKYQSPRYDQIHPKSILFSPDGKRMSFVTKQNGKTGVVLTDDAMPLVDDLGGWMGFSNDSKHFAFVGNIDKKVVIYYDGKPSAPYEGIGYVWFSPDSSHFAFVGRKGASDVIVLDGTERQTHTGLVRFLYSPNADRLAVLIRNSDKSKMILDGNESKEYDVVDPKEMAFSPDGKRFAVATQTGGKQTMVIAGESEKEYELVGAPIFSPDSKHLAYRIGRGGKYVMVLDGVEGKAYDFENEPVFSPDSKHMGYYTETNHVAHYVIDGVEGNVDSTGPWVGITWSPVGNHYSYIVSKGDEHFAVIDDVKSKSYAGEQESSKVTWSADGKHVAHVLSPDRKRFTVLIDGKYETPLFGGITGAMVAFDDKDNAHCIVSKDARYYHVKIAINP